MTTPNLLEGYADRHALAAMFGVTPRTITRWASSPDGLPHLQLGTRTLYPLADVREWLASRIKRPNRRRAA